MQKANFINIKKGIVNKMASIVIYKSMVNTVWCSGLSCPRPLAKKSSRDRNDTEKGKQQLRD